MNYCILGRAKVFFFGQDDRLARPRSVQTKVYCNHLCFWLGLEVCFLIVCDTIAQYGLLLIDALAPPPALAGADDDPALLQDNTADSATLAAGGGRPFHRRATRG